MNLKSTINSILFIFLSTTYANAQEDILNYGNSAKYAAHLFENKCYDLSAIEYERVVYLEPTDTLAKLRLV
ncbi:MAG TPA: hypothetical protein VK152_12625, partial [Paludibacter sp.]|nr:hypothetical protein [Paludibacter sp.]